MDVEIYIPTEAWLRIPEDVRKLLYKRDNNITNNNIDCVFKILMVSILVIVNVICGIRIPKSGYDASQEQLSQ
jgi:hypothetical protein